MGYVNYWCILMEFDTYPLPIYEYYFACHVPQFISEPTSKISACFLTAFH